MKEMRKRIDRVKSNPDTREIGQILDAMFVLTIERPWLIQEKE
jgi:hypothetical protein